MIRLEELKIGDKVYLVDRDGSGLFAESIVRMELCILDTVPDKIEAVVCSGGVEILTRNYEEYLFRTQKEAEENLEIVRDKLAKELLNSDKFVDRLLECATSPKRLCKYSEYPIYERAVKIYKESLQEKRH